MEENFFNLHCLLMSSYRCLNTLNICFSQVDELHAVSMLTSINTLNTAFVSNKLLRHPNFAIQVIIVSCLSGIFRIIAHDSSLFYDEIMQDIFSVIIPSLASFIGTSINSYATEVRILDTMANVEYFFIMLDLDCEQLIIDMFQYFIVALKSTHLENIFTSIETFMTLTLEESDNIHLDLIILLLDSIQNKHNEVHSIAVLRLMWWKDFLKSVLT